jgi:hypothetical protein
MPGNDVIMSHYDVIMSHYDVIMSHYDVIMLRYRYIALSLCCVIVMYVCMYVHTYINTYLLTYLKAPPQHGIYRDRGFGVIIPAFNHYRYAGLYWLITYPIKDMCYW